MAYRGAFPLVRRPCRREPELVVSLLRLVHRCALPLVWHPRWRESGFGLSLRRMVR
jgi:hypothetical protein